MATNYSGPNESDGQNANASSMPCLPNRAAPGHALSGQTCLAGTYQTWPNHACRAPPCLTASRRTMPAMPDQADPSRAQPCLPRQTLPHRVAPRPAEPCLPYLTGPDRAAPSPTMPAKPNRAGPRLAEPSLPWLRMEVATRSNQVHRDCQIVRLMFCEMAEEFDEGIVQ